MTLLHATCIAFEGAGFLLRGPSGAGKSDLALRALDAGASLVADDQVALATRGGRLIARAPDSLAGMIEARGIGVLRVPFQREAFIDVVVDLVPLGHIARMPEERWDELLGVRIPAFDLAPFESSTIAKLRLIARHRTGLPALVLIA